jgi:hypothetical protein
VFQALTETATREVSYTCSFTAAENVKRSIQDIYAKKEYQKFSDRKDRKEKNKEPKKEK